MASIATNETKSTTIDCRTRIGAKNLMCIQNTHLVSEQSIREKSRRKSLTKISAENKVILSTESSLPIERRCIGF